MDIHDRLHAQLPDRSTPEGVSVLVIGTDNEDTAREVGPILARVLFPDRTFGRVLHIEQFKAEVIGFEVVVEATGNREILFSRVQNDR